MRYEPVSLPLHATTMSKNIFLDKLIAQGEHQQLDFKYAITDAKKIARSFSAFANTDGGTLLLGVKDNGKVVGVSTDEEYYMIEAAAELYCKPPVGFTAERLMYNGKSVLKVDIAKSSKRPHFAPDKNGEYTAFIRVKDENFVADKILVKSWQKGMSDAPLVYTEQYDKLLNILKYEGKQTFIQLCKKAFISEAEAESILTKLVTAQLVKVEVTETTSYFSIAG